MTKMIAVLALLTLQFLGTLGNYWFTYGLWPKSWIAFVGFFAMSMILIGLQQVVASAKS